MKRKKNGLAEFDQQVRDVGASLLVAVEKIGGPAVFLFCGVRAGHGTTTIASAVAGAVAESGPRTVVATVETQGDETPPVPSHSLREVVESGGTIAFEDSRWVRLIIPRQFLDLPEAARDPRTWLKTFDLLIVDAPPLTDVATRYWVPRAHGVVLVVDGEQAGVDAVVQARDDVVRRGGTFSGVVLNRYRLRVPSSLR